MSLRLPQAILLINLNMLLTDQQGHLNYIAPVPICASEGNVSISQARLHTVDALRGIASFSVCWFHLTNGNPELLPNGFLKSSGTYGWLGVQVFFVISGFVIPFSMWRAGYKIGDFSRFIGKRITRIDPPYLASILLAVALSCIASLTPGSRGLWPDYSAVQALAHLGYLNAFLGYPWIIPVFWTLAIEFQYYLLIAATFPLLANKRAMICLGCLASLVLAGLVFRQQSIVLSWLTLFGLGLLTFQFKARKITLRAYWIGLPLIAACCCWASGLIVGMVGLVTALMIAFASVGGFLLLWLGEISYSLYLIHAPIGGRIVTLGGRFANTSPAYLAVVLVALVASLIAARVFYLGIERPAQRWASRIKYKSVSV
ncbi:MAG: acyltransferase [Acidobacteriota bacterium]